MADMGFMPQVEWVLRRLETPHQTLLFSATLDGAVDRLVQRYLTEPVFHEVASSTQTVTLMEHRFIQVHQMDKVKVAAAIARSQEKTLFFVRTKRGADRLVENLEKEGLRAAAIHGDLRQANRERALADFSNGKLPVLVATDVAARGLHIEAVDARHPLGPARGPQGLPAPLGAHGPGRQGRRRGEPDVVEPAGRGRGDPAPARVAHSHRRDVLQRPAPGQPGRVDAAARRERALSEAPPIDAWSPDDGVRRVLIVTAHPDDVDFGTAGTVAAFTKAGLEVTYCIATNGDAGGSDRSVSRADMAVLRQREQRAAAAEVGVTDVHFLGHPDGRLQPTIELRRDISRVIRQVKPERVLTQSPERRWDFIFASHPDHLAAGEAAVCAVYPDARNPFAHPELLDEEGLEPWTVNELWISERDRPQHGGRDDIDHRAQGGGAALPREPDRRPGRRGPARDRGWARRRCPGRAARGRDGRAVPGHPHPLTAIAPAVLRGRRCGPAPRWARSAGQLPEDVAEDPPVTEVLGLHRGVDADDRP